MNIDPPPLPRTEDEMVVHYAARHVGRPPGLRNQCNSPTFGPVPHLAHTLAAELHNLRNSGSLFSNPYRLGLGGSLTPHLKCYKTVYRSSGLDVNDMGFGTWDVQVSYQGSFKNGRKRTSQVGWLEAT